MSNKADKYTMFRNFMLNELDISKEDIKEWIKDSCKEVAENMLSNAYEKFNLESYIEDAILEKHNMFNGRMELAEKIKHRVAVIIAEEVIKNINSNL